MRAVVVDFETRRVRSVDDVEPPRLAAPADVRVRMLEVGLCGTDREIVGFRHGSPPRGRGRLVLGHEGLGEVVEVGPAVAGLAPGDLVVPMVRRPCGQERCVPCAAGRPDACATGGFAERGIVARDGFLVEEIVDDARWMVRVPAALRDVAVLTEPLTIARKALREALHVQARLPWQCRHSAGTACHAAVVLGAGPVGQLGAMALQAEGFRTWVYSRGPSDDPKAELARASGALYVSSSEVDAAGLAREVGSIDLVYEAAGSSELALEILGVLGTNGILVLTGVPGRERELEVPADELLGRIVLRNQVVLGVVNAALEDHATALESLERFERLWPGALERLVTRRVGLDDVADVLADGDSDDVKVVVELGR